MNALFSGTIVHPKLVERTGPVFTITMKGFDAPLGVEFKREFEFAPGFWVHMQVDLRDDSDCFIVLSHLSLRPDESAVKLKVRLAWRQPHFGGRRWYFICPATKKKVMNLYLPQGCREFLSREVYGIPYRSQREPKWKHKSRMAEALHRQLGGNGNWRKYIPPKEAGMKLKTYMRLTARLKSLRREVILSEEQEQERIRARQVSESYTD